MSAKLRVALAATLVISLMSGSAWSAKKKSAEPSPAQRQQMYERALKVCKKKYGANAAVYHIDYKKGWVTCGIHG